MDTKTNTSLGMTEIIPPSIVSLICIILILILSWLKNHWRQRAAIDAFGGPRAYFPIGNLHQFKGDSRDWLDQGLGCSLMYSRVYRIWYFMQPYLIINGAEEAEAILGSNKHNDKSKEYRFVQAFLGLGLLTSPAEKWRSRRKLLTPTFHYDILKDFIHVFNKQGRILCQKLHHQIGQGPFDIYPYITLCALAVICETSMGNDINAQSGQDSEYVNAIYKVNDIIHHRQKQPWFWPNLTFHLFGRGKEHDECLSIIHGFAEQIINQRYDSLTKGSNGSTDINNDQCQSNQINNSGGDEKQKKRLTFLDLLIKMVQEGQLTLLDVRDEVDTFMFEGHDTTSAGMNWALHLIGCQPEIQAKIQQEVDNVFGDEDRDVSFDDLKNLSYLECCLKEALRLFPSVPMFGRWVKEENCVLDGKWIPKGTQIIVNPYVIHRDPKHWPDPELYIPERFLPGNCIGRHPFAYIPFSAGPRNCIGQRFALMEEKTLMAWIFRYFTIKSVHRRDQIRATPELILRPENGVRLEISLRRNLNFAESMENDGVC